MRTSASIKQSVADLAGISPPTYRLESQGRYRHQISANAASAFLLGKQSFAPARVDTARAEGRSADELARYDAAIRFAARGGARLKLFEHAAVDELANQLRRATPAKAAEGETMKEASCCNRGDFWIVGYRGEERLLRDGKGLHHLAYLLLHPGRAISALDLIAYSGAYHTSAPPATEMSEGGVGSASTATACEVFCSAGEILDRKARTDYRRRLQQIADELVETKRFGHIERALGLEAEQDWLRRELQRASGLNGRARDAGRGSELARVNVTRAIRGAIERIVGLTPTLGLHLQLSVKTGGSCCYRTDLDHPVHWAL